MAAVNRAAILFLVVAGVSSGGAQAPARSASPASPNKLLEVRVNGSTRFSQQELAAATALKLGADARDDTLKQAADRLAASGMFAEVSYTFTTSPQGVRVQYSVADVGRLLPVHFDNFVWMPIPDLLKQLTEYEPLFRGEVPNAGEMFQHLAAGIRAILAKQGITAEVSAFPQTPPRGGEVLGFIYSVEGVKLPIRSLKFDGTSPEMDATLQKVASTSLLGNDYSESRLLTAAALDFLPQYRMRGFLRAEIGEPAGVLVDKTTGAVAARLSVKEGLCYQLAAVQWSGNSVFSATDLAKNVKVQVGKPLNQIQLEDDLGGIGRVYGTKGYVEAHLRPQFTFDDAAKTVTANVDVHEGNQYHMGNLRFDGLTDSAVAALTRIWKLRLGDVYDTSYTAAFLAGVSREYNLSAMRVQIKEQPKPDTRTVDVTFVFAPK